MLVDDFRVDVVGFHPIASHGAEKDILAAIICNPRAFAYFHGHINGADFDFAAHKAAWSAIEHLHEQGLDINPGNVSRITGPIKELIDVEAGSPSISKQWLDWRAKLQIVTRRRQLRELGKRLYDEAEAGDIHALTAALEQAARHAEAKRRATHGKVLVQRTVEKMAAAHAGTLKPRGILTGWPITDEMTDGFSGFCVVGARSSVGKTTMLCNMASKLILAGHKPIIFSAEMGEDAVGAKVVQAHAKLDWKRLRGQCYRDDELDAITRRAADLIAHDWWVRDRINGFRELRAEARYHVEQHGAGCVMIDYLQLIRAEGHHRSEYEALTAASMLINSLKGELNVPIIVAAQLNRETVKGAAATPEMHHLKGSGQIEQDADLILLLQRGKADDTGYADMQVEVKKQREGPVGAIQFRYHLPTQRIDEKPANQQFAPQVENERRVPSLSRRNGNGNGAAPHEPRRDDEMPIY